MKSSHFMFSLLKDHLTMQDLLTLRSVSKDLKNIIDPIVKIAMTDTASLIYPNLVIEDENVPSQVVQVIKTCVEQVPFSSIKVYDWRLLNSLPVTELEFRNPGSITDIEPVVERQKNLELAKTAFMSPTLSTVKMSWDTFWPSANILFQVVMQSSSLKSLELRNVRFIDDDVVKAFALMIQNGLKKLETLKILDLNLPSQSSWNYLANPIIQSPTLKTLHIRGRVFGPDDDSIKAIARILDSNRLEHFSFSDIVYAQPDIVHLLQRTRGELYGKSLAKAKDLTSLEIHTTLHGQENYIGSAIGALANLKNLKLHFDYQQEVKLLSLSLHIRKLSGLEHLSFKGNFAHNPTVSVYLFMVLSVMSNLKSLEVGKIAVHDIDFLASLAMEYCPKITELHLTADNNRNAFALSSDDIYYLFRKLTVLTLIDSNVDLGKLASSIVKVERLSITTNREISNEMDDWMQLLDAVKTSTRIRELELNVAFRNIVMDRRMVLLFLSDSKSLLKLKINGETYERNIHTGIFQSRHEIYGSRGLSMLELATAILGDR